jgi:hypothetical protein
MEEIRMRSEHSEACGVPPYHSIALDNPEYCAAHNIHLNISVRHVSHAFIIAWWNNTTFISLKCQ